jgi:RimJ/RimL family protein N-acetyltransferase
MPPFLGNELLRGEQVTLVRPTPESIATIASWSNDLEYYRLLRRGLVYPGTASDYQEWFAGMIKEESGFPFGIHRNDDDTLVGFLSLREIFWQARRCALVIGLDPAQRGHGYGTDAVRVGLKYAFLEMNLNRVELEVMSYNDAGIRVYTKVGFTPEGRRRAVVYRDGIYYDIILMGMLRSEWETLYDQPPVSYPAGGAAPG